MPQSLLHPRAPPWAVVLLAGNAARGGRALLPCDAARLTGLGRQGTPDAPDGRMRIHVVLFPDAREAAGRVFCVRLGSYISPVSTVVAMLSGVYDQVVAERKRGMCYGTIVQGTQRAQNLVERLMMEEYVLIESKSACFADRCDCCRTRRR